MEWITDNREWLFSGAFVAIPLAVLGWALGRNSKSPGRVQRQRGGRGSTNLQAGGDILIEPEREDD